MASALGKRKRRDQITDLDVDHVSTPDDNSANLQAFFRQHFESTFEPLPGSVTPPSLVHSIEHSIETQQSDGEPESDWNGFSDHDEECAETVLCTSSAPSKADISKDEFRTFMVGAQIIAVHYDEADYVLWQSAKPPSSVLQVLSTAKRKQPQSLENDETSTDAANLKKDLALQRLLKESHLLDSKSSLSHFGQNRHKAMDLRLQDMGSKTSVFTQKNMPLAQRKGITAKATEREELRRREAQENGIILEKDGKRKRKDNIMRQRGIGAPSVGKFQGGMLKLNKKDIAEIEGQKKFARRKR